MDNRQTGYGRKAKKSAVIVSAIILLLSVSLFFGIYLAPRQTKEVYAQANPSAPSEVESITVALNQDATNEHGVTGIYTSMSLQDLIERGYFLITAHYADKQEEVIRSVQQQIEVCVPDLNERIRQQEEALEQASQEQTM